MKIELIPVAGFPIVKEGDNIPKLVSEILKDSLQQGDIIVVTHSIVSIAEGKTFNIDPLFRGDDLSEFRKEIAISEALKIIREEPILITKTKHGLITDYSGVDESNAPLGTLVGLPENPDVSADQIYRKISRKIGFNVPVIIADTQGRPWRKGAVNLAIGVAGMSPFVVNRGKEDLYESELRGSLVCIADQVAAAAELVMGQADEGIPVVVVRGIGYETGDGSASEILREESENLFSK